MNLCCNCIHKNVCEWSAYGLGKDSEYGIKSCKDFRSEFEVEKGVNMKVILKINNMNLSREKCECIRDNVLNDLNEIGVAVVPSFVDVYILDDKTEVNTNADK